MVKEELITLTEASKEFKIPPKTVGNDSWEKYDWKLIKGRLRRITFTNPPKPLSPNAIVYEKTKNATNSPKREYFSKEDG